MSGRGGGAYAAVDRRCGLFFTDGRSKSRRCAFVSARLGDAMRCGRRDGVVRRARWKGTVTRTFLWATGKRPRPHRRHVHDSLLRRREREMIFYVCGSVYGTTSRQRRERDVSLAPSAAALSPRAIGQRVFSIIPFRRWVWRVSTVAIYARTMPSIKYNVHPNNATITILF